MSLPYSLHINPLTVVQCHRSHEIIRQIRIISDPVLLHIILHNLGIYFVVHIRPVERLCLALIIIRIDRLDAPGDAQHCGERSCWSDGKEL